MKTFLWCFCTACALVCYLRPNTIDVRNAQEQIKHLQAENEALKAYYNHAENLLDDLNARYDWVDAYDPEEYYDSILELRNTYGYENDCTL